MDAHFLVLTSLTEMKEDSLLPSLHRWEHRPPEAQDSGNARLWDSLRNRAAWKLRGIKDRCSFSA
jgi:hypothetical protein